jgi:hypothetical protein
VSASFQRDAACAEVAASKQAAGVDAKTAAKALAAAEEATAAALASRDQVRHSHTLLRVFAV